MSVVPLTLTISLCLVFTFVLFFLREFTRRRFSGAESESLLPLADETPHLATVSVATPAAAARVESAVSDSCGGRHDDEPGHVCLRDCAACRLSALQRAAAHRELSA